MNTIKLFISSALASVIIGTPLQTSEMEKPVGKLPKNRLSVFEAPKELPLAKPQRIGALGMPVTKLQGMEEPQKPLAQQPEIRMEKLDSGQGGGKKLSVKERAALINQKKPSAKQPEIEMKEPDSGQGRARKPSVKVGQSKPPAHQAGIEASNQPLAQQPAQSNATVQNILKQNIPVTPGVRDLATRIIKQKRMLFLSYCWSEECSTKPMVDDFEMFIKRLGFTKEYYRDLREEDGLGMTPGTHIDNFMKKAGQSDAVVIFLNDAYLRSRNCMYEFLQVWDVDTRKIRPNAFIIRHPDFGGLFGGPRAAAPYSEHWEKEVAKLASQKRTAANLEWIQEEEKRVIQMLDSMPSIIRELSSHIRADYRQERSKGFEDVFKLALGERRHNQAPVIRAGEDDEKERENGVVDHHNVKALIERHLKENPSLLNSSQGKDIVVFLGNTGAGKSTLINYLSGKALGVDRFRKIILTNPGDPSTMAIGAGGNAKTFLPQFIQVDDLLFYDLPGFQDTRGTATSLVNACFIKSLIEKSRSIKLMFVVGIDEITGVRGLSFKAFLSEVEQLIPQEQIENFSSLLITKSDQDREVLGAYLSQYTVDPAPTLQSWIKSKRIDQMSKPDKNGIDQSERANILDTIRKTPYRKIRNINISILYNGKDKNNIKTIYDKEMEDIVERMIRDKFYFHNLSALDIEALQKKKQYLIGTFRRDVSLSLQGSSIIKILSPISMDLYESSMNKMMDETLQRHSTKILEDIENQVKEKQRIQEQKEARERLEQAEKRAAEAEAEKQKAAESMAKQQDKLELERQELEKQRKREAEQREKQAAEAAEKHLIQQQQIWQYQQQAAEAQRAEGIDKQLVKERENVKEIKKKEDESRQRLEEYYLQGKLHMGLFNDLRVRDKGYDMEVKAALPHLREDVQFHSIKSKVKEAEGQVWRQQEEARARARHAWPFGSRLGSLPVYHEIMCSDPRCGGCGR